VSSYGTYKVTEKKCATCSFWSGARTIDFRSNKPTYIKADTKGADCIATKGRKPTPGTNCLKWQIWEKLD